MMSDRVAAITTRYGLVGSLLARIRALKAPEASRNSSKRADLALRSPSHGNWSRVREPVEKPYEATRKPISEFTRAFKPINPDSRHYRALMDLSLTALLFIDRCATTC